MDNNMTAKPILWDISSLFSKRIIHKSNHLSGQQLPPMQLLPTKMADVPNGQNKKSQFSRVYQLQSYFEDSPHIDWLFKHLHRPQAYMSNRY